MDDRIRVSDADRDRVAARLRDHFAEGRLTHEELDQRVSAALNAKTFGDLRPLMADLPGPGAVPQPAGQQPQWAGPHRGSPHRAGPPWAVRRRGPRVLPLVLLVLFAALVVPGGGWVLAAFFKTILLVWLVMSLAGLAFGAFRRRAHRYR